MMRMKLWLGIGAFVVVQTGHIEPTPQGLTVSVAGTPALAGERGEGERGERGEGERGEGERGERGEGEGEGEGEGARRRRM